jgi:hypothetical protein
MEKQLRNLVPSGLAFKNVMLICVYTYREGAKVREVLFMYIPHSFRLTVDNIQTMLLVALCIGS